MPEETEMKTIPKRVKIVATIGPASSSTAKIRSLIKKGVNVFRINFSHGDHSTHMSTIFRIRRVTASLNTEVAILADLQGPKIRTLTTVKNEAITLKKGTEVVITARKVPCTETVIAVDYNKLYGDITPGQEILINDGAIRLKVTEKKREGDLTALVTDGGSYSSHKGVNFPNVDLSIPSLTARDRKDLSFILDQDIQYIALSFVRKAADVNTLRSIVRKKRNDIKIIAKIEKPEAARGIEEILASSDGIMVARGDLGVEATPSVVPIVQKGLVQKANKRGKLVIVATQMLESMITNAIPTRAESTDVANAIIDGTDAIMLSGETAVGRHPEKTVEMMVTIASATENSAFMPKGIVDLSTNSRFPPHAICEAAVWAGRDLGGIPLCVYTISGETALYLAKLRYQAPVFSFSPELHVVKMLNLSWNIHPFFLPFSQNIVRLQKDGEKELLRRHLVRRGDMIGIISGTNAVEGATNYFRIKKIDDSG